MAPSRHEALVLRHTKLGESDVIVTFLVKDGSLVRAVAKGLRKSGSRFGARLEPFSVVDLHLSSGRTLGIVTDVAPIEPHIACRGDFERTSAASAIVDVVARTSLEGQAERVVFDLTRTALDTVCAADIRALPLVVATFLLKLLAVHGYRPSADGCPLCGGADVVATRVSLDVGFVCDACSSTTSTFAADPSLAPWVAHVLAARFVDLVDDPVAWEAGMDLLTFSRRWAAHHVDARFKALDFMAAHLHHD